MTRATRLAVVTGTSSGIGQAVAEELLRAGWRVMGIARRTSAIKSPRYAHLELDLGELGSLLGRVDEWIAPRLNDTPLSRMALVNNAADPGMLGTVSQLEPTAVHRVLAVDLTAPIALMGWAVRRCPVGIPLRIVNLSSGAATSPFAGLGVYGSAKAALKMAGMVLASELDLEAASRGPRRDVSVLCYSPGPVDTPMQATARAAPSELFPLKETFIGWSRDGTLISPAVPAAEIRSYLDADGYPGFHACRVGELVRPSR